MAYFLYRLNPPRKTFFQDITPGERQLMGEHSAYWKMLMEKGVAIAFGPVANPADPHGICILHAEGRPQVETLGAGDPCIESNRGFSFEIYPMPALVHIQQAQ